MVYWESVKEIDIHEDAGRIGPICNEDLADDLSIPVLIVFSREQAESRVRFN